MPANISPLLRRLALQYNLDPEAVEAVARGEGGLQNREEDIGDLSGGGSYGPFQLYTKGALPARYHGRPQAADQWAWSPEGIKYALSRMVAAGAGGLRGADAVNTIIRKFERPAKPDASVAAALARLRGGSVAQPVEQGTFNPKVAGSIPAALTANPNRDMILQGLIAGKDPNDLLQALRTAPVPSGGAASFPVVPSRQATPPVVPSRPGTGQGIKELIYGNRAVFDGTAVPYTKQDHDDHLHYAAQTAQKMLQAFSLAQKLGLVARENPYVDPVDPVHTKGSHHYQSFPGKYNGRLLGQAADFSGNPAKLKLLYQRLAGL